MRCRDHNIKMIFVHNEIDMTHKKLIPSPAAGGYEISGRLLFCRDFEKRTICFWY